MLSAAKVHFRLLTRSGFRPLFLRNRRAESQPSLWVRPPDVVRLLLAAYSDARELEIHRRDRGIPLRLIPRRRQVLAHALTTPRQVALQSTSILWEYNTRKHGMAEQVFGQQLQLLNPKHVPLRSLWRGILLIAIVVPGPSYAFAYLLALASTLNSRPFAGSRYFVCNPYHLVHLVPALLDAETHVYFHGRRGATLRGKYFRRASTVRGTRYTLSVFRQEAGQTLVEIRPGHLFSTSESRVAFYFSRLALQEFSTAEARLGRLALWVIRNTTKPVVVYLHPEDLSADWCDRLIRAGLSDLRPHVRDLAPGQQSLNDLSLSQVSFSGTSSIGGQLQSLELSHVILNPDDRSAVADLAATYLP